MRELRLLSPYGILRYGFPESSFLSGMAMNPDVIMADADSTDAGPHKLGAGVAIVSHRACKKDLEIVITNGARMRTPVVIGSAGGAGDHVHMKWTPSIAEEISKEHGLQHLELAVIWADIEKKVIKQHLSERKIDPLGPTVNELIPERIEKTTGVVAQMGHEPIVWALEQEADIVVCGHTYDPSPFAAVAIFHGFDMAYGYHVDKILGCAALCAQPGTARDCMFDIIREDGLVVTPLSEDRVCTKTSVAAHISYEEDHPYLLHGSGIVLNLERCTFIELEGGQSAFVTDSWIERADPYRVKLEGAMPVAFRTFIVTGVRNPFLIGQLEEVQDKVKAQVYNYYGDVNEKDYKVNFIDYSINGMMGEMEPCRSPPHEVDMVFEMITKAQELTDAVCSSVHSTFLHYRYEGRESTTGNLAFPFAPSGMPLGRVYEFSLYHLMDVRDGEEIFPVGERKGDGTR